MVGRCPDDCDCPDTMHPERVPERFQPKRCWAGDRCHGPCRCGAWADGRDCMCHEFCGES